MGFRRSIRFVSGDLRAGNAFPQSVRTLMEETFPPVSGPPGNPRGFQARADFAHASKSRPADF
jgi:hypothetical protein